VLEALHFFLQRKEKPELNTCSAIERSRVARWFVFKPKIPIWVNFGGP
jgi:hypothetical protein